MQNKVIASQTMYEGAICQVKQVQLQAADGRVIPRDLVAVADAVVILPVLDDGSVVLIRNERFSVNESLWELPAGKIDPGETPDQAAARELTEETGYSAGRLVQLGGFYTSPGCLTEYIHAYLAEGLAPGPQELEGYETIQVQVTTGEVFVEMIRSGQIHDAKTIAAWGLWRLRGGA